MYMLTSVSFAWCTYFQMLQQFLMECLVVAQFSWINWTAIRMMSPYWSVAHFLTTHWISLASVTILVTWASGAEVRISITQNINFGLIPEWYFISTRRPLLGINQCACALYEILHAWTFTFTSIFKMWMSAPTTMEDVNKCVITPLVVSFVTVWQATDWMEMG